MAIDYQDDGAKVLDKLEHIPVLTLERWSTDPFDSFPIKMHLHMHEHLYLYVSAFAEFFYPIETHWGFNPTKEFWVPMALTDPALLSAILFCSHQFGTKLNNQKESPSAIHHLKHTIGLLHERLQESSQEISDSTIATVASLALSEQSSGNQANWGIHMDGIRRMVEMRGGLMAFKCIPVLHDKLCRADISGSMYGFSKPYLLSMESRSVRPSDLRGCHETERTIAPGFHAVHDKYGLDSGLFDILHTVYVVTQDINMVNPQKSDVTPLRLRERIRSVQYYLLDKGISEDISGSEDKVLRACRLGIWLYLIIIQNDVWISSTSVRLASQLKTCLEVESLATNSLRALRLWLLFLAGPLVLDPNERSWFVFSIAQAASHLSLSHWGDAKLLLEDFAWVTQVQDMLGQKLWDEAMTGQSASREGCDRRDAGDFADCKGRECGQAQ